MKKSTLSNKLIIWFLLLCLGSVMLVAFFSGHFTKKILLNNAENNLSALAEVRKKQVSEYFNDRIKDARSIAASELAKKSFEILSPQPGNTQDSLKKDTLDVIASAELPVPMNPDSIIYRFDGYLMKVAREYDLADLYLVTPDGQVVYSKGKDKLFGSNLIHGDQSTEVIGKAFRAGREETVISDFERMPSKGNEIFSFVATPVYSNGKELLGVLLLQLDPSSLSAVIKDTEGLGSTGEVLLVGSDNLLRSNSRHNSANLVLTTALDPSVTNQALSSTPGTKVVTDQRRAEVIAAFRKLDINGLNWGLLVKMDMAEVLQPLSRLHTYALIFSGALALVLIVLVVYLSRSILRPVSRLRKYLVKLSKGELPDHIEVSSNDELGEIVTVVNDLTNNLRNAADFAVNIGEGNFDSEFNVLSDKDKLGHSLTNMRDRLLTIAEEDKKRNWTTEGLARFGDILRSSNDDLTGLSSKIISNLVTYLNANQGGLFIVNSDSGSPYLELIAAYAYERKKYLTKRVEMGEGLVGQAWQERDTILLTDVPGNYVHITSGLGDANPRSILIIPLKVNEEIFGVVEIASFNVFEKHEVEFVQKLGESIASTISTVRVNERTKKLLEDSQVQAEQLRAQEEEMRQNIEEIQATQEEIGNDL